MRVEDEDEEYLNHNRTHCVRKHGGKNGSERAIAGKFTLKCDMTRHRQQSR